MKKRIWAFIWFIELLPFLLVGAGMLGVSFVHAGPTDVALQQRNASDNGAVTRLLSTPAASANGIMYLNGATVLPGYLTIGNGLAINSGVLSASAPEQVRSDWLASSGVSAINNKPTISTAGMTGNYNDLANVPVIPAAQVQADWGASSGVSAILNKPTIPTYTPFNFGAPGARSLVASTVYQANDPTRAAIISVSPQCTASISLAGGATCAMQVRQSASPALTCNTGTITQQWTNGNTGTLTIGLALNQIVGAPGDIKLPIGGYFALCPVSGTFTVNSAVDQTAS